MYFSCWVINAPNYSVLAIACNSLCFWKPLGPWPCKHLQFCLTLSTQKFCWAHWLNKGERLAAGGSCSADGRPQLCLYSSLFGSEESSSPNQSSCSKEKGSLPWGTEADRNEKKLRTKYIQRNFFWGKIEEFICFVLQSSLLFSLIYCEDHKLQLGMWEYIHLWWWGLYNKHQFSVLYLIEILIFFLLCFRWFLHWFFVCQSLDNQTLL